MTGFARRDGGDGVVGWAWEIKSVNGKALDVRLRVPGGYERLEPQARSAAQGAFTRGSLQISLQIDQSERPPRLKINQELLSQLLEQIGALGTDSRIEPARLDGLLAIRGMLESVEEREDDAIVAARDEAQLRDLAGALEELTAARHAEGVHLAAALVGHIDAIAELTGQAQASAALQPEALRAKLQAQLEELLGAAPALPEDRLAQEAALLITKADIREELDRLVAHVAAARALMAEGGPVGRRLDFLCQEFNREANTLCAKSPDVALKRIGLELKSVIEQLREQVQNLE